MADQGSSNRIQERSNQPTAPQQRGNQQRSQQGGQFSKMAQGEGDQAQQMGELGTDVVNYLTEYTKQNPGYAALWCLGIGFVLGWKLKPW
jgi:hypothetical protein